MTVEPLPLNTPEPGDAYPMTLGITERVTQALELPYPPSVNNYWRIFVNPKTKVPRIVVTGDGARYKEHAKLIAARAGMVKLKGDIRIRFDFYRPAKRGDLDNTLKVAQDVLSGLAFDDDAQICYLEAHRHEDKENPRVHITIEGDPV